MTGTSHRNQKMVEDAAAFTINGKPFDTWAGPVALATGIEWRREWITGAADATSLAFGWFNSSYQPTIGSFNVTEGFVEALFPLAKDAVWAQSFDVDLAARYTHYSQSGSVVTWKIGPTWQPINDIRVRGSISRDIRAPNLGELFAGGSNSASGGAGLLDPFNGNLPAVGTISINGSGNPFLKPEKATSTGLGVVLQPGFWPGFLASVDYWNIKMDGAVGAIAAQEVLNQCFLGKTQVCAGITRPPVSPVLIVRSAPFNIATSIYRGVDFEAAYKLSLDNISESMGGTLENRFLATLSLKNYTDNGITPASDLVGSGVYRKWRWSNTVTYTNDPITVVVAARGFSAGVVNTSWIQCTSGCPASTAAKPTIDNMEVRGDFDLESTITYKVSEQTSAYISVQNWLNREPPPNVGNVTGVEAGYGYYPSTIRGLYTVVGRSFRVGMRFKM